MRLFTLCSSILLGVCLGSITGCNSAENSLEITSPDRRIQLSFQLKEGIPFYSIFRDGKAIITASKLGFLLKNGPPFNRNFKLVNAQKSSYDSTWTQVWGEVKQIRNHYNQLRVELQQNDPESRRLIIEFRLFDDGVGFRYEFPEQEHLQDFQIMDEQTEFVLAGDYNAWWIPVYRYHRYEYIPQRSPISKLDTVHTPLTIEAGDSLYLCIHEANLTDYASMTLIGSTDHKLRCDLEPWSDGVKVKTTTPTRTPWRTIQIADQPGKLATSWLDLNLNEPNQLQDVSWIKPAKYVGIWWGMHMGKYTWGSGPRHGATTANAKKYIDFAAKHGFYGVLIEGWNIGWDGTWWQNGSLFRFTEPHPDFDIAEVTRYAHSKGVKIIGHHETGADIGNYEKQMEDAFKFCKKYGIDAVKTGYVGDHVVSANGTNEWHHGQYMVEHYRRVVKLAAQYHIMLDVHEPIKDTGIRRTWPNMMTREGARGQEYNAWGPNGGNPVDYLTILPFTRMLAGPMDYTPGIFNLRINNPEHPENRVKGTLAKELAIYVVIYSPLQMAADLPENYENQPAFKFIEDVAVDWDTTLVPNGKIGDYITTVRKDRHSDDWYIGSITDENARILQVKLDFLDAGRKFVAEIYADAADTDWQNNPQAIDIYQVLVDNGTVLKMKLAPGGGQAVRLRPATEKETVTVPAYQN